MKLRVKFKKYGPVRYIGHLDVMRYFQKSIRRAGIDVAYSTGFSPHQIMTFAAPLGVGLTSNGEYMDIQVNSLPRPEEGLTPCETVQKRLNLAGVEGLDVADVRILPEDAGNAMASVAAASYTVRFRPDRLPLLQGKPADEERLKELTEAFLSQKEILITKETKRGTRTVDLRPGIYELTWDDGTFRMLLDASSAGNIRPALVMEALITFGGGALLENALLITREDVFTVKQEGDARTFISLGEIGSRREQPDKTQDTENGGNP